MILRNRKKAIQLAKKFDAFPKVEEKCIKTSSTGGTFSLITFLVMGFLIVWETNYYLDTKFTFKFNPDINFKEKLKINIDLTVKIKCNYMSIDTLDVTGQAINTQSKLSFESTWYDLDHDQQVHFDALQRVNSYLNDQYHSVHHVLWKNGYIRMFGDMPARREIPKREKDACRIHGSLDLNKVAGNLHVTAGRTITLLNGNIQLALLYNEQDYSFSHRIQKLSFGDDIPGIIHPLEGDVHLTESRTVSYQYFINVVPTKVNTYRQFGYGYQYSVSMLTRNISHDEGSHGTPGIFFKYDVAALQVEVTEQHEPFLGFLTRLVGIVGGVFACSRLLHTFIDVITNGIYCRYSQKPIQKPDDSEEKVIKTSLLLDAAQRSNIEQPIISPPTVPATNTL